METDTSQWCPVTKATQAVTNTLKVGKLKDRVTSQSCYELKP